MPGVKGLRASCDVGVARTVRPSMMIVAQGSKLRIWGAHMEYVPGII